MEIDEGSTDQIYLFFYENKYSSIHFGERVNEDFENISFFQNVLRFASETDFLTEN